MQRTPAVTGVRRFGDLIARALFVALTLRRVGPDRGRNIGTVCRLRLTEIPLELAEDQLAQAVIERRRPRRAGNADGRGRWRQWGWRRKIAMASWFRRPSRRGRDGTDRA